MWNGAVFMPLIEEIETIEPGRRCALSSAATAWLMKNIVSRFCGEQRAPVGPGDPGRTASRSTGAAPPATLTSP